MQYNLEWLIAQVEKKSRVKFLFFWGHQKRKSDELTVACFSQWWASPFTVAGVRYNTTKH